MITCSWLTQAEASDLTGDAVAHLQKPDLHYADFTRALASAGIDRLSQPAVVSAILELLEGGVGSSILPITPSVRNKSSLSQFPKP